MSALYDVVCGWGTHPRPFDALLYNSRPTWSSVEKFAGFTYNLAPHRPTLDMKQIRKGRPFGVPSHRHGVNLPALPNSSFESEIQSWRSSGGRRRSALRSNHRSFLQGALEWVKFGYLPIEESISKRGLTNEVNGLSFFCPQWKSLKQRMKMGLPILDQGRTVRISPRFKMLSTARGHRRICLGNRTLRAEA